jgi:hypothetical protein
MSEAIAKGVVNSRKNNEKKFFKLIVSPTITIS